LITRTPGGRLFAIERQPFFTGLPRFIIMELLIHHLDTIRYLVGPVHVTAASAVRVCPEVIGEDVALISLKSDRGALGTVSGNLSAAGFPPLPADRLELIGDKGSILFEDNILCLRGTTEETIAFDFAQAYQQSYDNAIAHFVQALQDQTPFETGPGDNLQTLRLVEAAYRKSGFSVRPAAEKDAGHRHSAT
jgi:predicted dehydrogenase